MKEIFIAAAAILRADGALLLARKKNTAAFMLPGGKIEPGESAEAALIRELQEELALDLAPGTARYLGRFEAPAANEAGHVAYGEIYRFEWDAPITVQAEIAEAVWVQRAEAEALVLAPLTRQHVLPLIWD
ncbi:NUDIX hydrolase [Paracoccaceae bacterium GXU_MW_L88]